MSSPPTTSEVSIIECAVCGCTIAVGFDCDVATAVPHTQLFCVHCARTIEYFANLLGQKTSPPGLLTNKSLQPGMNYLESTQLCDKFTNLCLRHKIVMPK